MARDDMHTFREEVEKQIDSFNRKQMVLLAWLCAVRALPFLSNSKKREFGYWNENVRQTHLLAIFNAVNVALSRGIGLESANYIVVAFAAYADSDAHAAHAAYSAYYSAYAAAYSAYGGVIIAADAAANAAHNTDSLKCMQDQIRIDIKNISQNINPPYETNISIYGNVWHKFLDDLHGVGCSYWANHYQKLFDNGFVADEEEIERILSVPEEIQAQGAAAVGQYLENLGDEIEGLNETRIIILGEPDAGKTSLARRLKNITAPMPDRNETTEGVINTLWTFPDNEGDKNINAHIWDFAGQSITHAAHRCFMSARCLYIYVYRGRIEGGNNIEYWLEQIRIHGGDSRILFLVNKTDDNEADIAVNTLRDEYPSIVDYYYVDIGNKDTTELEDFRNIVMDQVRNNPAWSNQVISKEAYEIKAALQEHFKEKKSPHITRNEFDAIAEKYGVKPDRAHQILKDLHTLGICLCYEGTEMGDNIPLVLNPDWIADGIYRIINKGHKEKQYVATVDYGVEKLTGHERYSYSYDEVAYLFKLMRKYELAYFKETDKIFIPGILPKDKPDNLPKLNDNESLTMVFEVTKALPPNIVCRVIVNRNQDVQDETLLWRKGAILRPNNMNAMARIIEDGRGVTVDVVGEDKTAYLSELRTTIETIFKNYEGLRPELKYKILLPEEIIKEQRRNLRQDAKPPLETESKIKDNVEQNVPIVDETTKMLVYLMKTAKAYAININVAVGGKIVNGDNYEGSVTNTVNNFYNNVVNLQGELNNLARRLRKSDYNGDAEDIEDAASALDEVEQIIESTPEEKIPVVLKKKGITSILKEFYENLGDKDSALYKHIVAVTTGVKAIDTLHKIGGTLVQYIPEIIEHIPPEIMNSITSVL